MADKYVPVRTVAAGGGGVKGFELSACVVVPETSGVDATMARPTSARSLTGVNLSPALAHVAV